MESTATKTTAPKIRVVVRKRPLNSKELRKGEKEIVKIQNARDLIVEELK